MSAMRCRILCDTSFFVIIVCLLHLVVAEIREDFFQEEEDALLVFVGDMKSRFGVARKLREAVEKVGRFLPEEVGVWKSEDFDEIKSWLVENDILSFPTVAIVFQGGVVNKMDPVKITDDVEENLVVFVNHALEINLNVGWITERRFVRLQDPMQLESMINDPSVCILLASSCDGRVSEDFEFLVEDIAEKFSWKTELRVVLFDAGDFLCENFSLKRNLVVAIFYGLGNNKKPVLAAFDKATGLRNENQFQSMTEEFLAEAFGIELIEVPQNCRVALEEFMRRPRERVVISERFCSSAKASESFSAETCTWMRRAAQNGTPEDLLLARKDLDERGVISRERLVLQVLLEEQRAQQMLGSHAWGYWAEKGADLEP